MRNPSDAHVDHQRRDDSHASHATEMRTTSWRRLWFAFCLTSVYAIAEVIGGVFANSLALLADAAHMLTDVASLGLAIFAMWLAKRAISSHMTFGYYRAEILAALINAVALWAIAGWVIFAAWGRFTEPPEVAGPLMLAVGSVGLAVNIGAALALTKAADTSLNVEGAFIHVLGDLLGSLGVMIASAAIMLFGWNIADPLFAVLIGVLVLVSATRLAWKVGRVLMQGSPAGFDLGELCGNLEAVRGVVGIHDLHAWTLTSGYHVLSAHITTGQISEEQRRRMLRDLRGAAAVTPGVAHMTFQLEEDELECEEERHHAPHD